MSNHIEVIARGIVIRNSQLLICRSLKRNYGYLPGGHLEPGEPAAIALAREFLEETGETISVGAFACLAEICFTRASKVIHELNVLFHVEQFDARGPITSREPDIAFEWVELSRMATIDFRPRVIRDWLLDTPTARANFISEFEA